MLASSGLHPLLCRSPLFPDESLPSYLSRLVIANRYDFALLTKLCNIHLDKMGLKDNLERPIHPETFDILSSLTRVEPRELANASDHHFAQAPILSRMKGQTIYLSDGLPFSLLERCIRSRHLRGTGSTQFCPECLAENAYYRLSWMLLDAAACPKHQRLLVDRCQACGTRLTLRNVVQRGCTKCGADLAAVTSKSIQDDPLGLFAQRTIQTWWGLGERSEDDLIWALPEQPAPDLYQLFEWLVGSSQEEWLSEHPRRVVQGPADQYVIQRMAFTALVDWPRAFHRFLRYWLEGEVRLRSYRFCDNFRKPVLLTNESTFAFWARGFSDTPEWNFIQEAVDQFLVENGVQVRYDLMSKRTRIRVTADEDLQQIAQQTAQRASELYQALLDRLDAQSQKL